MRQMRHRRVHSAAEEFRSRKRGKTPALIMAAAVIITGVLSVLRMQSVSAYLSDHGSITNEMSVGTNVIRINEDYKEPILRMGENSFKKVVTVTNTGTVPCYIRVFMGFSDSLLEQASALSADDANYYPLDEYRSVNPASGWIYNPEDGYFYYTECVEAGEETLPLLRSVKAYFDYDYGVIIGDIIVYAESVQSVCAAGEPDDLEEPWRSAFYV